MNNNQSKNEQSVNHDLVTKHVFTENGAVFVRSSENLNADEWSLINFHWMPVLELERELRFPVNQ
ncbi:hypothetical protein M3P19_11500 [Muricauda sp. 2012CJ35-5]|uniref:Uncharacterized protein n=1 Tax=Flagellimonas spongiicola TaxID=2942208 RepID=A0ABT0PTB6_9FLAO|nr:hypothetical protein [Allomuricauda spongiicola]MCL6274637.1 hypothetical protein [Allomuricauda spongiicola]